MNVDFVIDLLERVHTRSKVSKKIERIAALSTFDREENSLRSQVRSHLLENIIQTERECHHLP
jgi:hypothetical protein